MVAWQINLFELYYYVCVLCCDLNQFHKVKPFASVFFTNWSVYQKHRYKSMQRLLFGIDLFIILQMKQLAFLAMSMCLFLFWATAWK